MAIEPSNPLFKFTGIQERSILEYKVHYEYFHPHAYFDVAVVKLSKFVDFTSSIHPICLPTLGVETPDHLAGAFVSVIGYANRDGSNEILIPKALKFPIHKQAICNSIYGNVTSDNRGKIDIALPNLFNHPTIICAGDFDKKDGTCPGDSGD